MVAHRKLTSEWRGGGTTVRGSHIRIWLRLYFWCPLCHSACQIRALTAISCGFPAIPKAEQSQQPEPEPDDAAALGHAAQTFPLCNYFKSKAKLDRPPRRRRRPRPRALSTLSVAASWRRFPMRFMYADPAYPTPVLLPLAACCCLAACCMIYDFAKSISVAKSLERTSVQSCLLKSF